ncbi:MAG: hypothetical protein U9Q81_04715 [Pseudomonadota bacterium]|nr:hypothetical protein [Pseudomonadota bacterium]
MRSILVTVIAAALVALVGSNAQASRPADEALHLKHDFDTTVAELKQRAGTALNQENAAALEHIRFNVWPHEALFGRVHVLDEETISNITTGVFWTLEQLSTAMGLEVLYGQEGCFAEYSEEILPMVFHNTITPPGALAFAEERSKHCRFVDTEELSKNEKFQAIVHEAMGGSLRFLALYQMAHHIALGGSDYDVETIAYIDHLASGDREKKERHMVASVWAKRMSGQLDYSLGDTAPVQVFLAAMAGETMEEGFGLAKRLSLPAEPHRLSEVAQ